MLLILLLRFVVHPASFGFLTFDCWFVESVFRKRALSHTTLISCHVSFRTQLRKVCTVYYVKYKRTQ
jgi:hypothetical protein